MLRKHRKIFLNDCPNPHGPRLAHNQLKILVHDLQKSSTAGFRIGNGGRPSHALGGVSRGKDRHGLIRGGAFENVHGQCRRVPLNGGFKVGVVCELFQVRTNVVDARRLQNIVAAGAKIFARNIEACDGIVGHVLDHFVLDQLFQTREQPLIGQLKQSEQVFGGRAIEARDAIVINKAEDAAHMLFRKLGFHRDDALFGFEKGIGAEERFEIIGAGRKNGLVCANFVTILYGKNSVHVFVVFQQAAHVFAEFFVAGF